MKEKVQWSYQVQMAQMYLRVIPCKYVTIHGKTYFNTYLLDRRNR